MILNPDLATASVALLENRLGDVLGPLECAASVTSNDAEHWQAVAQTAMRIGDDDLALAAAARLRTLAPKDVGRRALEMQLLGETGAVREALKAARSLASDHPTDARWHFAIGTQLARLGRDQEAIPELRRAMRQAPISALAWESLANLKFFTPGDPDFAALKREIAVTREPSQAAAVTYALGKAYDDIGEVDLAFEHFQRGAQLMLRGRTPRMDSFFAQSIDARTAFPAERLAARNATGREGCPILVIGSPRSGTTLIERILATSPDVRSGGELKMVRLACLGFSPPGPARLQAFVDRCGGEAQAWDEVARTYVTRLTQRFGRVDGVVDKGLVNYLYVGAIAMALPRAKFVFMRRDPIDVAWSCFRRRFHDGLAWSYHFESLAAFIRVYEDMCEHWRNMLPGRILTVDFEDLVSDPDAETQRVFDFVEIRRPSDWHAFHQLSTAVITSSQQQVRRPLSADGVGAWRRYEKHLSPLIESLGRHGALARLPK